IADQKRRSIVCARNRNVEDFILNIDISLLPFSTSEMRAITRLRNISLIPVAKRAAQCLPPRIRLIGEQACYQRARHSYFVHCNRDEGQHSRNSDRQLREATTTSRAVSVIPVPFASSVICVVTQL